MNKKGNYRDIPEYIGVVVFFFFAILISFLVLSHFNTNVQSNSFMPVEAKSVSTSFLVGFTNIDYVIPVIYLIFLGFSVLAARFIPSSPKFMIISVFWLVLLPVVAMFTENFVVGFLENSVLSGAASSFPFSSFFLNNLVGSVFVYSLVVAVALLTKGEAQ